ncbi:hypothetical protein [Brevundimonas sp. FT23042]|uniref:hypothetical protein n=1 Tax=Brevundimonas sp. FT23042 TaxID=3393749 RepID=UPI003B58ACEE
MTAFAQALAILAGVWLIGLGMWMAVRPRSALAALATMGGSPRIHFGEMIIRIIVGAALIGAAAPSRAPLILTVFGGFLIVSALVLMVLPRRWHHAYSTWWAARIPVLAVRFIGPFSVIGGLFLLWSLNVPGQT